MANVRKTRSDKERDEKGEKEATRRNASDVRLIQMSR